MGKNANYRGITAKMADIKCKIPSLITYLSQGKRRVDERKVARHCPYASSKKRAQGGRDLWTGSQHSVRVGEGLQRGRSARRI